MTTTITAISRTPTARNVQTKGLSSAALCIELVHLDVSFRPEFTHQCFDGAEWIRGYLPHSSVLNTDPTNATTHASHGHHELATHELQIQIKLAPSCETCNVQLLEQKRTKINKRNIMSTRRTNDSNNDNQNSKRIKVTAAASTEYCSSSSWTDADVSSDTEDSAVADCEQHVNDNDSRNGLISGNTQQRRMTFEDIKDRLQRALPPIVSTDIGCSQYHLTKPIGTILKTWKHDNHTFTMTLADAADAASYHVSVQNLALWFIETASPVDLTSDEGGGYWKVLYVFESSQNSSHNQSYYALAGYMTLFHFYALFKKPKPGIIVRVCQALVLPSYQRMGLGSTMLHAIYELDETIVELTVQDPAPSFTALRNRVDYERSIKENWFETNKMTPPTESQVVQMAAKFRVIPNQVYIAYELYRYNQTLLQMKQQPQNETDLKEYRLMVKKRLLKLHQEDLSACPTKEARQALLGTFFDELLQSYKLILKVPSE